MRRDFTHFATSKNSSQAVVCSIFFVLRQTLTCSLHLPPAAVAVAALATSSLGWLKSVSPPNKKSTLLGGFFVWRRKRDLNPRDGYPPYSLSRGAPSADLGISPWRSDHLIFRGKDWRREWDSNPRCVAASPVFKTGSLNRSDISPFGKFPKLQGLV